MFADGMRDIYRELMSTDAQLRWPWLEVINPCISDTPFYQRLADARTWCYQQMGPPGDRWVWWMVAAIPNDCMMIRLRSRCDHALFMMVWR
jgi:hypothetical protein